MSIPHRLLKVKRLSQYYHVHFQWPSNLRIKEPSEGLRLGLEQDAGKPESFYMKYKNKFGVQITKTDEKFTSSHSPQDMRIIELPSRPSSWDRSVISFAAHLSGEEKFTGDGSDELAFGGFLATQLMQFHTSRISNMMQLIKKQCMTVLLELTQKKLFLKIRQMLHLTEIHTEMIDMVKRKRRLRKSVDPAPVPSKQVDNSIGKLPLTII